MVPLALQSGRGGADTSFVMTVSDLRIYETIPTTVPRGPKVGLWSKLTAELSRSAAGSGLAGSVGPGQPISAVDVGVSSDMFAYDASSAAVADDAHPF